MYYEYDKISLQIKSQYEYFLKKFYVGKREHKNQTTGVRWPDGVM